MKLAEQSNSEQTKLSVGFLHTAIYRGCTPTLDTLEKKLKLYGIDTCMLAAALSESCGTPSDWIHLTIAYTKGRQCSETRWDCFDCLVAKFGITID